MVKKQFIAFNTYGKVHEYYPLITKNEYFKKHLNGLISKFFGGSVGRFASFFTNDEELNLTELEEIKEVLEEKIEKLKNDGE